MSKGNQTVTTDATDATTGAETTAKNFKTIGTVTLSNKEQEHYEKLLNQLNEALGSGDDPVVFAKLRKGMKFKVKGVATRAYKAKNRNTGAEEDRVAVSVTTNVGVQINPKHFASLDDMEVGIGTTKEDVAAFVAYHSSKETEFEVTKYTASSGEWDNKENPYVPEYAEFKVN